MSLCCRAKQRVVWLGRPPQVWHCILSAAVSVTVHILSASIHFSFPGCVNNNNYLAALYPGQPGWVALYPGQPGWAGTRTHTNVNLIYHPHCPHIPHEHSQPTPRPSSLPPGSNTWQNPGATAERSMKNARTRTDTFLYSLNSGWGSLLIAGPLSLYGH